MMFLTKQVGWKPGFYGSIKWSYKWTADERLSERKKSLQRLRKLNQLHERLEWYTNPWTCHLFRFSCDRWLSKDIRTTKICSTLRQLVISMALEIRNNLSFVFNSMMLNWNFCLVVKNTVKQEERNAGLCLIVNKCQFRKPWLYDYKIQII